MADRRYLLVATLTMMVSLVLVPRPAGAAGPTDDCLISEPSAGFAAVVSQSPDHARVWRLYQATFLRQPDAEGLAHWVEAADNGMSLTAIAAYFTDGPEFRNRYGALGQTEFVDLVYGNVLCRTPDAEGRAYWTGLLRSGTISRPELIVNFAELREYLRFTQTCHSIHDSENAASPHCQGAGLTPLTRSTLAADGYQAFNRTVNRIGGGTGTLRAVEIDLRRGLSLLSSGDRRCSVASINGNWLVAWQKDGPDPGVLGLGIVDGRPARNSADRTDRGVFGLRVDPNPKPVVEVWPGDTLSLDDIRLNSVLATDGDLVLESWHAAAEASPYLQRLEPDERVEAGQWLWAAAGIPLRIAGQTDVDFTADYGNDPYTYRTLNHSFVAVDLDSGRLVLGATATLDTRDLVAWAQAAGYEDLIKFDGGASTEFNVDGRAVVAGTGRDIPVWLGIGC